jgi:hypothetical protein
MAAHLLTLFCYPKQVADSTGLQAKAKKTTPSMLLRNRLFIPTLPTRYSTSVMP